MIFQFIDISEIIAALALVVAILAYFESKKLRKDQGGALLFIDMMQINSNLYVVIHNIGNSYAYDVKVELTEDFANRFSNLRLIQPLVSYQYVLLNSQDVSKYPREVIFNISYRDRYFKKKPKIEKFRFVLTDYLQYDVQYNSTLHTYNINKTY